MNRKIPALLFPVLLLLLSGVADSYAQSNRTRRKNPYRPPDKENTFLDTQWWLGLKTGINFTKAVPGTRYAVFSPINYDATTLGKTYGSYQKAGMQAGIEVTFYHKGFSLSLQPNYRIQRFGYQNQYSWSNPAESKQSLTLNYAQKVRLRYIEIPLFIKYDILQNARFRPFVQVGGYYAILSGADKSLRVYGHDRASGGVNAFEGAALNLGAEALFLRTSAGVLGGAGVNYDLWKIRLVLDVVYRYGWQNITHGKNRYASNSLSGLGDTMDDMTLNSLSFSLGFLFPLRFISKDFNAIN